MIMERIAKLFMAAACCIFLSASCSNNCSVCNSVKETLDLGNGSETVVQQEAPSNAIASFPGEENINYATDIITGAQSVEEYLPLLRQWADSEFEAVREHARWAIEQIELARRRT